MAIAMSRWLEWFSLNLFLQSIDPFCYVFIFFFRFVEVSHFPHSVTLDRFRKLHLISGVS